MLVLAVCLVKITVNADNAFGLSFLGYVGLTSFNIFEVVYMLERANVDIPNLLSAVVTESSSDMKSRAVPLRRLILFLSQCSLTRCCYLLNPV